MDKYRVYTNVQENGNLITLLIDADRYLFDKDYTFYKGDKVSAIVNPFCTVAILKE